MKTRTCTCEKPNPGLQHVYAETASGYQRINLERLHRAVRLDPGGWRPGDDIEPCLGPRIVESDDPIDHDLMSSEWSIICNDCEDDLPAERLNEEQLEMLYGVGLVEVSPTQSMLRAADDVLATVVAH